jgi:hypothetical protein
MMMLLCPALCSAQVGTEFQRKVLQISKNCDRQELCVVPASSPDFDFFVSDDVGGAI